MSFSRSDNFIEPFPGVCLRVDCTEACRYAKERHLSLFLTLLRRSLVAAQQIENFMIRSIDAGIVPKPVIIALLRTGEGLAWK